MVFFVRPRGVTKKFCGVSGEALSAARNGARVGRYARLKGSLDANSTLDRCLTPRATYDSDRYASGFVIKTRIALPDAARQHSKSRGISRSSVVGACGPSLALQSPAVFSNPI
jgi:hypothetical protein